MHEKYNNGIIYNTQVVVVVMTHADIIYTSVAKSTEFLMNLIVFSCIVN